MRYNNYKKCIKDLLKDLKRCRHDIADIFDRIENGGDDNLVNDVIELRAYINLTLISIWTGCRFIVDTNRPENNKICIHFSRKYANGGSIPQISMETEEILAGMKKIVKKVFNEKSKGLILKYETLPEFAKMETSNPDNFMSEIIMGNITPVELFHLNKLRREFGKKIFKLVFIIGLTVVALVAVCGCLIKVTAGNDSDDGIASIQVPDFDSVPDINDSSFAEVDKALAAI